MKEEKVDISVPTGLLVLRLILGFAFFLHGSQKLFGWFGGTGLEGFAMFLSTQGLDFLVGPTVMAWLVGLVEFLGGIFIIFGFLTRFAGLGITLIMLVAIAGVHWGAGFFAQDGGCELPLIYAASACALMLTGAGRYSLDSWLLSRYRKSATA